jgi:cation:H+ antiporter
MDLTTVGMILAGLVLLTLGAEVLVRGASRLAAALGLSPLVIGLTVVAYGTSTPELAVSVRAGLQGSADIAVANVVGSNIFNVLCILGACAVLLPLTVAQQLVRLELPVLIGVSLLLWALALDGRLGAGDGAALAVGLGIYTAWAIRRSRRETAAVRAEYEQRFGVREPGRAASLARQVLLILAGLALLVLGATWMVDGAVALAESVGVSDLLIGLTIVAVGTGLPEIATSILATLRGERDIAIGNVVGSSIYNVLAILGISILTTPGGLIVTPALVDFDIPVMAAVAVVCLPIFFTGRTIERWEGALLLGLYLAYTAYLILDATQHEALPVFSGIMLGFVLPGIGIAVVAPGLRSLLQASRCRPLPAS